MELLAAIIVIGLAVVMLVCIDWERNKPPYRRPRDPWDE